MRVHSRGRVREPLSGSDSGHCRAIYPGAAACRPEKVMQLSPASLQRPCQETMSKSRPQWPASSRQSIRGRGSRRNEIMGVGSVEASRPTSSRGSSYSRSGNCTTCSVARDKSCSRACQDLRCPENSRAEGDLVVVPDVLEQYEDGFAGVKQ